MITLQNREGFVCGKWNRLHIDLASQGKLMFKISEPKTVYEHLNLENKYTISSSEAVLRNCKITTNVDFELSGYSTNWDILKVPDAQVNKPGITEFKEWWVSNDESELENDFKVIAYKVWKACWELREKEIEELEERIADLGYACMGDDL